MELKAIIEVQRGMVIFDEVYLEKLLKEIGKDTFSKCPICHSGELCLTSMTTQPGYQVIPPRVGLRGPA